MALCALVIACACGEGVTIEGVVSDDLAATHVWVVGEAGRDTVADGAFSIRGLSPGTIDLRVGTADEEVGVLRLDDVPARATVALSTLRRMAGDRRLVPDAATVDGAAATVLVNGVRMGRSPIAPADTVEVHGAVLSTVSRERRLLLRPDEDGWPDLEVLIDDGTEIVDGEPKPVAFNELRTEDQVEIIVSGHRDHAHLALELRLDRVVQLPPPRPRIVPTPPQRPRILGEPAPGRGASGRGQPPRGRGRGRGPP